jgi:hypothetical protein
MNLVSSDAGGCDMILKDWNARRVKHRIARRGNAKEPHNSYNFRRILAVQCIFAAN